MPSNYKPYTLTALLITNLIFVCQIEAFSLSRSSSKKLMVAVPAICALYYSRNTLAQSWNSLASTQRAIIGISALAGAAWLIKRSLAQKPVDERTYRALGALLRKIGDKQDQKAKEQLKQLIKKHSNSSFATEAQKFIELPQEQQKNVRTRDTVVKAARQLSNFEVTKS